MFALVAGLFSSAKSSVITVAVAVALTFVGVMWWQKNAAERRVERLMIEKAALTSAVLAREIEVGGLKIAIETLEETMKRIATHQAIESETNEEISNAPPESDGPVAPVLRDALRGVERMYHNQRS